MKINFYERYQPKNQLAILEDALRSNSLFSNGKYADLLSEHLKKTYQIDNILFTTSATTALELAVQLLELKPGDEVLIPSYNFPSAANAVLKSGGIPILCDVEKKTKNISLEDTAFRITSQTKAVIPTHYAGISCNMDELMDLAKNNNITVIEDAAQAVNGFYKQTPLGAIGDFGAYSFHHTKNFSCGEGGAFLMKDSAFMRDAEILKDNGTNKAQFLRNEVSSYSWQRSGSNYILSEACVALLYAQILAYQEITSKRKHIADIYTNILLEAKDFLNEKITPMEIPSFSTPNYHIYYVNCANLKIREILRKSLFIDGIDVRSHFVPLHISTFGKKLGYQDLDLPNSLAVSETILRLPIHTEMTGEDAAFIANLLIKRVKEI